LKSVNAITGDETFTIALVANAKVEFLHLPRILPFFFSQANPVVSTVMLTAGRRMVRIDILARAR
jgi:hypothetical protein